MENSYPHWLQPWSVIRLPPDAREAGHGHRGCVGLTQTHSSEASKRWHFLWQEGILSEFTEMESEKDLVFSPGGVPTRRELKLLLT